MKTNVMPKLFGLLMLLLSFDTIGQTKQDSVLHQNQTDAFHNSLTVKKLSDDGLDLNYAFENPHGNKGGFGDSSPFAADFFDTRNITWNELGTDTKQKVFNAADYVTNDKLWSLLPKPRLSDGRLVTRNDVSVRYKRMENHQVKSSYDFSSNYMLLSLHLIHEGAEYIMYYVTDSDSYSMVVLIPKIGKGTCHMWYSTYAGDNPIKIVEYEARPLSTDTDRIWDSLVETTDTSGTHLLIESVRTGANQGNYVSFEIYQ